MIFWTKSQAFPISPSFEKISIPPFIKALSMRLQCVHVPCHFAFPSLFKQMIQE